jgi:hypothetical protein
VNDELAHCPTCGGKGYPSYLRSNMWFNARLPARNGPLDVDSSPMSVELDNYDLRRLLRIEYKRPHEEIPIGQYRHFRAELESTRDDWWKFFLLVEDKGQSKPSDLVAWGFRTSRYPKNLKGWSVTRQTTIEQLANRISLWLWGRD